MRVDDFDFELPQNLIALHPHIPRDAAQLLCLDGAGNISGRQVFDLGDLLRPGDVLVLNDTKVLPAELNGWRIRGDFEARVSFNLHKRVDEHCWVAFARPAKKLQTGDRLIFGGTIDRACAAEKLVAHVSETRSGGQVVLEFDLAGAYLEEAIKSHGAMPLPPYISSKRAVERRDNVDYQTVYAKNDGAVAAPTAGLHFTEDLLDKLTANGILVEYVTLHVGAGTFLPMKVSNIKDHQMHAEWGEVDQSTVTRLLAAKAAGGRIVAVGTTSLRLLESACLMTGDLQPFVGDTDIFITPGFEFRFVDLLMTNFHLPRSTLFMLVCAFSGYDRMKNAYAHAVKNHYRFYSYGDASLLWRNDQHL